jgi:hypothetical protein
VQLTLERVRETMALPPSAEEDLRLLITLSNAETIFSARADISAPIRSVSMGEGRKIHAQIFDEKE